MLNDQSPFSSSMSASAPLANLSGQKFLFRRKLMKLIGGAFYVYDSADNLVLYADQKAFKLKEDICVYSAEDKQTEVLRIAARSFLDWSAAFDVYDSASGHKIGVLRRQGLKSIARDEWQILDAQDREMGLIQEDSMALALVRRFVEYAALLLPQKYTITLGNREVGRFSHVKNPFSSKIEADFSADPIAILDRRLALAAGVLLCAIEGKQR